MPDSPKTDAKRKKPWCADEPGSDYFSSYLHAKQCETAEDREKLEFERRQLAKKLSKESESNESAEGEANE